MKSSSRICHALSGGQGLAGQETVTLAGLGQGLGRPFFSFLSYFPNGLLSLNQHI
jgi:hypothetical protein